MTFPFGRSFTCHHYPLIDNEAETGLDATQSPTIYVFDEQPSRSAAAAGTGAIATIESWEWDSDRSAFEFTVPALDDPEPESATEFWTYFLGINYRLQASEQIQTVVQPLPMERVKGQARGLYVSVEDLQKQYAQIEAVSTEIQRLEAIQQATRDVKTDLSQKGFDWWRIHNADDLRDVVALRAIVRFMLNQAQSGSDKFAFKYTEYKALYEGQVSGMKLEYDSNGDNVPDTATEPSSTVYFIR